MALSIEKIVNFLACYKLIYIRLVDYNVKSERGLRWLKLINQFITTIKSLALGILDLGKH